MQERCRRRSARRGSRRSPCAPTAARTIIAPSTTSSIACAKAARTPPRSSAARPRAVVPPGEATARRTRERVVAARAQQLGRAGHRLRHELGGRARRHAARAPRRRPAPRPAAPSTPGPTPRGRAGDAHQALRDVDDRADAREAARATAARSVLVDAARRARRRRARRACTLDRRVRLDAEHRRARVGGAQVGLRRAGEDRDDAPWRSPAISLRDRARAGPACGRGHDVGALGELAVGGERLAAELVGERGGAAGAGVGAQHGLAPAARERAGHVPGADEADLHDGRRRTRRSVRTG